MVKQLRSEYKLLLDANEMNFDPSTLALDWGKIKEFNRYPDPTSLELRTAICDVLNQKKLNYNSDNQYISILPSQLIVGTGSDEILKLILEGLTDKGSVVLSPTPSFSEYEKLTELVKGQLVKVPCSDLKVDIEGLIYASKSFEAKVIFLANPNNPTGQLMTKFEIEKLLLETDAYVVVDEAYAEFSEETTLCLIEKYKRLLITRTLSKAYGLASLRIGYLIASESVVSVLSDYKMTYNITGVSESIAIEVLKNTTYADKYIKGVKNLRKRAFSLLNELENIMAIPSDANFILIKIIGDQRYLQLKEAFETAGVKVRYFKSDNNGKVEESLNNCIRVTLTTEDEFMTVLSLMKGVLR